MREKPDLSRKCWLGPASPDRQFLYLKGRQVEPADGSEQVDIADVQADWTPGQTESALLGRLRVLNGRRSSGWIKSTHPRTAIRS